MTCPNCRTEAPEDAQQCARCGTPLAAPAPPSWAQMPGATEPAATPPAPAWGSAPGGGYGPPQGQPSPGWGQQPYGQGQPSGGWGQVPPGGQGPWGNQQYPAYQPSSGWGSSPVLAGWWRRVGATVIDGIIVAVIVLVLDAALHGAGEVLGIAVSAAYAGILLAQRGQTVGMMAVGTRCIKEQTGANLAYGPSFGRWAIQEVFGFTVILYILDALWPLWDSKNQTLHDKVVGSLVVMA